MKSEVLKLLNNKFNRLKLSIALGPICFFISAELTPQQYRSLIQSIVIAVNTVISLIITFLSLPAYNWIDIWSFIPLFVLPSIISIVYIAYVMPETRGREIYQIIEELKGSKSKTSSMNTNYTKISENSNSDKEINFERL